MAKFGLYIFWTSGNPGSIYFATAAMQLHLAARADHAQWAEHRLQPVEDCPALVRIQSLITD
jgi:hypothetical protein